jgi:hypothetical protein
MLITQPAPILIVENHDAFGVTLSQALRHAGITNPLLRLPDAASAELYLNGAGQFSDRKKYPLPCLVLLDVTLHHPPSSETTPWLTPPPISRQLVVTSVNAPLDPDQFESAIPFAANSVLCKLITPESLAAMMEVLRETVIDREPSSLAAV